MLYAGNSLVERWGSRWIADGIGCVAVHVALAHKCSLTLCQADIGEYPCCFRMAWCSVRSGGDALAQEAINTALICFACVHRIAKRASWGKVIFSGQSRMRRPWRCPRIGHCGAWLWVSTKPGMKKPPDGMEWNCESSGILVWSISSDDLNRATILPAGLTTIVALGGTSSVSRRTGCRTAPWKTSEIFDVVTVPRYWQPARRVQSPVQSGTALRIRLGDVSA